MLVANAQMASTALVALQDAGLSVPWGPGGLTSFLAGCVLLTQLGESVVAVVGYF